MREGFIPTVLGTAVTTAGAVLEGTTMRRGRKGQNGMMPMVAAGIIGFGLAHVVLGTIDLIEHRND